jgi:hypothetical protein
MLKLERLTEFMYLEMEHREATAVQRLTIII